MFLDDTACNLASLNLLAFHQASEASPSPRMRGEGRGEAAMPRAEPRGESPSPGMRASADSDLSPPAGRGDGPTFDIAGYEHAVRLWTVVLEISVLMAQFPSREIAQLSYEYRTLGLGYANLGGLLMSSGIPYDFGSGPRDLRRAVGDHDRGGLRDLGGDGGRASAPSPATRRTASRCCA